MDERLHVNLGLKILDFSHDICYLTIALILDKILIRPKGGMGSQGQFLTQLKERQDILQ